MSSWSDYVNEVLSNNNTEKKPDMVEVVRCGNCVHGSKSPWGHPTLIWCPLRDSHRNPNWFCADGKKEN